jgi:hypothetical protein
MLDEMAMEFWTHQPNFSSGIDYDALSGSGWRSKQSLRNQRGRPHCSCAGDELPSGYWMNHGHRTFIRIAP